MAIAYVGAAGSGNNSAGATLAITTTIDMPAGSTLIVTSGAAGSPGAITGISTSAGALTGRLDKQSPVVNNDLQIASADVTTLIPSGSTITITWTSSSGSAKNAILEVFSGLATTPTDRTLSTNAATTTSPTIGPSAATTQADELVIACFGGSGGTQRLTAVSGYTLLTDVSPPSFAHRGAYLIVSSTGTQTANGTFSVTQAYDAVMATYKAAAPTGVAFDAASSSAYQAAVSSYNWSHTCTGANRVLLVGISIFAAGTVSGITYNGVAMTLGSTKVNGLYRSELWYLIAPATGAHSIAVTLSTSLTSIGSAVSYTGVNQTTPIAEQASASGTGNPASVSVTTLTDNQWTTDLISTSDAAITVGAGQTSRANNNGALGSGAMSDKGPTTPAGVVTQTWTAIGVTDAWAYIIAGLDPALDAPVYNVTLPDADTEICANDLVISSYVAGIASRRLLVGVGV